MNIQQNPKDLLFNTSIIQKIVIQINININKTKNIVIFIILDTS